MTERARIRINLSQHEFEVEGSEAFVQRYAARLEDLLARLGAGAPPAEVPAGGRAPAPIPAPAPEGGTGRPALPVFGEFIHHLPTDATEVDKMLAAGLWVQLHGPERSFATAEASRRLAEHGIRIGNPSQCVRQNIQARRVFVVRKGRYRVSDVGVEHLRRLMGEVVPEPGRAGG